MSLFFWSFGRSLGITDENQGRHASSVSGRKTKGTGGLQKNISAEKDGLSYVYQSQGGSPKENMRQLIDAMGGIETIIGKEDIVIIKPNAQWWNQGMTNTDLMKSFIDSILSINGFAGEVIIAENHQYREPNSRGWITEKRNGRFNYNELIAHFNNRGHRNVTKYHWQCAGDNPVPLQGDACCGNRVSGPSQGDGYVWREDIVYTAPNGRECLMTYPIFTSSYSGFTIDLKNGAWKEGHYVKSKKVKFINFSALNHHGAYAGVTASIKNLMGVVDMTCGFQGREPEGTYNTHFIGISDLIKTKRKKLIWRIWTINGFRDRAEHWAHRNFHFAGGALGTFMREIKMPDLNIISAEWVGWGSRTDTTKSTRTKTVLASKDPVALDYVSARDVLLEATPATEKYYRKLNDPTIEGPFYRFLLECNKQGIGNLNENRIKIRKV